MRALIIFFLMIIGSQTAADCGNLCNEKWWKTSTITDVKQELTAGAQSGAQTSIQSSIELTN